MINDAGRKLAPLAILAALLVLGYYFARSVTREEFPGENDYRMSNKLLEEGDLRNALISIDSALAQSPSMAPLHLTKGIILLSMGQYASSKEYLTGAITLKSDFAEAYANRGILNDTMGLHREALKDYRAALRINPSLGEGPGTLWRFARNIHEKQSTILDRARYLESELKKPPHEQRLKYAPRDSRQRMYQPGKIL